MASVQFDNALICSIYYFTPTEQNEWVSKRPQHCNANSINTVNENMKTIFSFNSTFILSINRRLSYWDISDVFTESDIYLPNNLLISIHNQRAYVITIYLKSVVHILFYHPAFFLYNSTIVVLNLLVVLNNLFLTLLHTLYEKQKCLLNIVSLKQSFIAH